MIASINQPALTPRQEEVLQFIRSEIAAGAPPTIREIGDRFRILSPNGILCHLKALEKKGYILRKPRQARNIRVV